MATFGNSNSAIAFFPAQGDRGVCSAFIAPANGTITSLTFIIDNNGSINCKGIVYADNGSGKPGAVLGVGAAVTASGGGSFTSGSLSVSITNGTKYWLGVVQDNITSGVGASSGTEISVDNNVPYASPTTWTENSTTASFDICVFATYTAGGGTSVNLTGQTITSAEGAVGPEVDYTLGGQAITSSEGTPTPTVSYGLGGQKITSSEGAITAAWSGSATLGGQAINSALGAISVTVSYPLAGQGISSSEGSIAPEIDYAVAGQAITSSEGIITAQAGGDVTLSLTGLLLTSTLGIITAQGGDVSTNLLDPLPIPRRGRRIDTGGPIEKVKGRFRAPKAPEAQDEDEPIVGEIPAPSIDPIFGFDESLTKAARREAEERLIQRFLAEHAETELLARLDLAENILKEAVAEAIALTEDTKRKLQ